MAINSTEDPQGLRETCSSVADQAEGVPLGTRMPAAAHADQEVLQGTEVSEAPSLPAPAAPP